MVRVTKPLQHQCDKNAKNVSEIFILIQNLQSQSTEYFRLSSKLLQKGGDPSPASARDALLRLNPSHWPCLSPHKEPLGIANFHGLTGGEYKTRERIQRAVADARLLVNPTSCRRVAACNPNYDRLFGISSTSRFGNPLYRPLYHACSPRRKSHADLTSSPPSSRLRGQSLEAI